MLDALKSQVFRSQPRSWSAGISAVHLLATPTAWIGRRAGGVKPSGVPYEGLTADDMVVSDLKGKIVEAASSHRRTSITHLELYRAFPAMAGWSTRIRIRDGLAQAGREDSAYGTTHADYFTGRCACRGTDREEVGGIVLNQASIVRDSATSIRCCVWGAGGRTRAFSWRRRLWKRSYAVVRRRWHGMAFYRRRLTDQGASRGIVDRHHFRKHGQRPLRAGN